MTFILNKQNTLGTYYMQLWMSTISTSFNKYAIEDILDKI